MSECSETIPAELNSVPLLASMAEFRELLEPFVRSLNPGTFCEIGVEFGQSSRGWMDLCRDLGCTYTAIDPSLDPSVVDELTTAGARVIQERSVEALESLEPQEVYIIDGDHNYYTVSRELDLILAKEHRRAPVLIFHDVSWPCARRDLYYNPDSIPESARHEYDASAGPVPGQMKLQPWGFGADGKQYPFHAAKVEGGPGNGVLTAIEDARTRHGWQDARWVVLPVVFGLGILAREESLTDEARSILDELDACSRRLSPLLQRLDANRVLQHLLCVRAIGQSEKHAHAYEALTQHSKQLTADYSALHDSYKDLNAYYKMLSAWAHNLQRENEHMAQELAALKGLGKTPTGAA